MSEDGYEIIDRFLEDDLSNEELAELERRIQQDPALRERLAFRLSLRKAIREEKEKEIRNMLDKALAGDRSPRLMRLSYRIAAAAAAVLLIVAIGAVLFFQGRAQLFSKKEALAEVNRIIENNQTDLRNAGGAADLALLRDYRQELAEKTNPCDYKDLSYYAGVYNLFIERDFKAALYLLQCVEAPRNEGRHFRPDVPRLLVIAYAGVGDYARALSTLKTYDVPAAELPPNVRKRLQLNGK